MRKSAANIIYHNEGIDAAQRLGNWSSVGTVQKHYTSMSPELVGEQLSNLRDLFFSQSEK